VPDGYLLDNNVISVLLRPGDARHSHVKSKFEAIGDSPIALPIIAIAEIEFGIAKTDPGDPVQQAAVRQFFQDHPWHLGIDFQTVEPYALIRAKLWNLYGTPKGGRKRGHQEKLPDQLRDKITGQWIGIDERDLLIVSVALQHNLRFATVDRNDEMKRIEVAVDDLLTSGKWSKKLLLDDWTPPKTNGPGGI
jgi:predicted nucleic acid-binding protein